MKGLILCAGKGTRLQPLSYSQPKTLLPVANKPVIFYCIEHLIKLGIKDIGIVINRTQEKVMKDKLGTGQRFGAKFSFIFQSQAKGIADAIKQAEPFIGSDSFLLLLGDNLIQEPLANLKKSLEQHEHVKGSIMLAKVENPQDYGIAEIKQERIIGLQEKPKNPKSDLAVIGAYAFDSSIFKAIHAIPPSARGEYEITDAIQWMLDRGDLISYSITKKKYSDVGNVQRWLEANRWMLDRLTNRKSVISSLGQHKNCTFLHPVSIDRDCVLKDSTIGPYVSIAQGAKIEGCNIQNSIVLEGAQLKHIPKRITHSVFGQFSLVDGSEDEWESIEYILGDKSSIIEHGVHHGKEKGNGTP